MAAARTPRRRWTVGLLVLVLLAAGALWSLGHRTIDHVQVVTGKPQCEGTSVIGRDVDDDGFVQPVVPMRRGFRCVLSVRVANGGDYDLVLGRLRVPVAGPGARSGFRVSHIDGRAVRGSRAVTAVVDLDSMLPPGTERVVDLRVEHRKSGCTSPGGTARVYPTIEVRSMVARGVARVSDLPGFGGTTATSCDT